MYAVAVRFLLDRGKRVSARELHCDCVGKCGKHFASAPTVTGAVFLFLPTHSPSVSQPRRTHSHINRYLTLYHWYGLLSVQFKCPHLAHPCLCQPLNLPWFWFINSSRWRHSTLSSFVTFLVMKILPCTHALYMRLATKFRRSPFVQFSLTLT